MPSYCTGHLCIVDSGNSWRRCNKRSNVCLFFANNCRISSSSPDKIVAAEYCDYGSPAAYMLTALFYKLKSNKKSLDDVDVESNTFHYNNTYGSEYVTGVQNYSNRHGPFIVMTHCKDCAVNEIRNIKVMGSDGLRNNRLVGFLTKEQTKRYASAKANSDWSHLVDNGFVVLPIEKLFHESLLLKLRAKLNSISERNSKAGLKLGDQLKRVHARDPRSEEGEGERCHLKYNDDSRWANLFEAGEYMSTKYSDISDIVTLGAEELFYPIEFYARMARMNASMALNGDRAAFDATKKEYMEMFLRVLKVNVLVKSYGLKDKHRQTLHIDSPNQNLIFLIPDYTVGRSYTIHVVPGSHKVLLKVEAKDLRRHVLTPIPRSTIEKIEIPSGQVLVMYENLLHAGDVSSGETLTGEDLTNLLNSSVCKEYEPVSNTDGGGAQNIVVTRRHDQVGCKRSKICELDGKYTCELVKNWFGKANCGARGYPTDIAYQIVVTPVILRLPTESSINQNYWCVKLIDCKCLGTGKRDGSCNVCKDWIANNTCPKLVPASVAAQWCSLLMGQETNKKSSRQMMKRIRSEYETVDRS